MTGMRLSRCTRSISERPAARHDDVDDAAHREHQPDGGAVAGRHQLDGCFRQAGGTQPFGQRRDQRPRRVKALGSAAQDRRVAGFERQPAGVCRDIRPALVNDADDAERHGDALDGEPVRPRPFGEDTADRIGQRRRSPRARRRSPRARFGSRASRSRNAARQALRSRPLRGRGHWPRGCPASRAPTAAAAFVQRRNLGIGGSKAESGGGLAGAPPDLGHFGGQIRPRSRRRLADQASRSSSALGHHQIVAMNDLIAATVPEDARRFHHSCGRRCAGYRHSNRPRGRGRPRRRTGCG